MRRITSSVLIGLGAFLIMAAVLVKFYAYPNLAVVPSSYESTTTLEAKGATIFDAGVLAPVQSDLAISSYTYTNPEADPNSGYTAWVSATSILRSDVAGATCDPTVDPALPGCFQQSTDRSGFDNSTGVAASAEECGDCPSSYDKSVIEGDEYVAQSVDITREGQLYKAPFDTQKKDMLWWDGSIAEATTMEYVGEEDVEGLTTLKFVQTIEPTNIGTQDLPGKVFGLPDATLTADVVYAMTRTLWIAPATGSPVKRSELRNQVFSYEGQTVPAFVGTVAYTDDVVTELVADAKSKTFLLNGMQALFPILMLLLGLASIAGGLLLRRGGGDKVTKHASGHKDLVNA